MKSIPLGILMGLALSIPVLPVPASSARTLEPPPATAERPVVDVYHGEQVTDPFRWLENWDDPQVQAWSEAQNARTRALLDSLPFRKQIEGRLTQLLSWESPSYGGLMERGGRLFGYKHQPPRQQPVIVVLESTDDPGGERVLVDPNALDASGGTSIDWFEPSWDGTLLAVSLSRQGTEAGDVHLIDVATGRERSDDLVPRANSGTAGGSLAWKADGSGFWYTRHPWPGEAPPEDASFYQQVFFHSLGRPAKEDRYELGKELPKIAENFLASSPDGSFLLDLVQDGDGGEYELYFQDLAERLWRRIARDEDQIIDARFAPDGSIWLLSRQGSGRGKILRLEAGQSELGSARSIVSEGEGIIEYFEVTKENLWVVEQLGGPSRLRRYDLAGRDLGEMDTPPVSSIGGLARSGDASVLFAVTSYLEPGAWFLASRDGAVHKTALVQTLPADMSDVEVLRLSAVSKDGTRIPYTILQLRGTRRDGNNPTLLTGYGGFAISMSPGFDKESRAWLEQGGVIAVANLRGGGEYGEAWHRAGYRTQKQHVFDDFIAVAEALVSQGFTRPERLAIEGGSNGGLLMGAALTQRPDLFRVVVAEVGYFDMLRYETRPNGAFNRTEYGSVTVPEEYRALRLYSPYHQVKAGTRYPPTLFLTGANDPRVDPMHSRKMVARLQAAGADAFLRTSGATGHGGGTPLSARIAEAVDRFAFLLSRLGVNYRQVGE